MRYSTVYQYEGKTLDGTPCMFTAGNQTLRVNGGFLGREFYSDELDAVQFLDEHFKEFFPCALTAIEQYGWRKLLQAQQHLLDRLVVPSHDYPVCEDRDDCIQLGIISWQKSK